MQHELMIERLKALKLHGMAQALTDLVQQDSPAYQSCSPILSQLLRAELTEREVRSIAYQMKVAKFPAYRDLQGFDFGCSEVNEALVRQLHRGEFIEPAHNVVLVGGPGTGKTHLATAFAVHAIEHLRRRVRFFSTIELVNTLEIEKQAGKAGHLAHRLMHSHVVILDELGICHSAKPAARCCSTSSASSTSTQASSSPPISASLNGRTYLGTQK